MTIFVAVSLKVGPTYSNDGTGSFKTAGIKLNELVLKWSLESQKVSGRRHHKVLHVSLLEASRHVDFLLKMGK